MILGIGDYNGGELVVEGVRANAADQMTMTSDSTVAVYSVLAGLARDARATHDVGAYPASTNRPSSWRDVLKTRILQETSTKE